jgi:hypothetical protein
MRSLKRSFSSSLRVSERRLIIIGLSAVLCSVLAVFLMILESEAAEGAPFSSHIIFGTDVRLDLRRIMLEDRLYDAVHSKKKKWVPRL